MAKTQDEVIEALCKAVKEHLGVDVKAGAEEPAHVLKAPPLVPFKK